MLLRRLNQSTLSFACTCSDIVYLEKRGVIGVHSNKHDLEYSILKWFIVSYPCPDWRMCVHMFTSWHVYKCMSASVYHVTSWLSMQV